MPKGYFIVFRDQKSPKEIHFQVASAEPSDPPEEQLVLKTDVERVLSTIQTLYSQDESKFEETFRALLSLAQCGLVGPNAQPGIASRALSSLKEEIVFREAGRVKNRYLEQLGKCCLVMTIPSGLIVLGSLVCGLPIELFCFALLWAGAVAGVWLSYAYRKTHMRFEDLTLIEEDRLEPPMRIAFVGLLTMLLGLILLKHGAAFELGSISTKDLGTDPVIALLVGALCGFSEQALPSEFAKHAARFFEKK